MISLVGIRSMYVPDVWDLVAPMLSKAIKRDGGEQTAETIYESLLNKNMQLWIGYDDEEVVHAGITEIITYPSGKKAAQVLYLAGSRMSEWAEHHLEIIEDWARSLDCQCVNIIGRKGWQKVHKGYIHRYTAITKEL